MNRPVVPLLLAALALLGVRMRMSTPTGPAPDVPMLQPGSAEAEQEAWRLRLVELTLTTGEVPRHDHFLDAPEGRPVPWPPLFGGLIASVARHTTLRARDARQLGSLGNGEVLELAARLVPLLGALGVLAAFLAARSLHGGEGADLAGLCAAALWALSPTVAFAEHAGRLDPHALAALLAFALLGATSFALRAREEVDATLGGLLAGVTGGLVLACSVDGAVVVIGCGVTFGLAAWRRRPGAGRGLLLAAVACAVTASMSIGRETSWLALLPVRVGWDDAQRGLRHFDTVVLGCGALVALAANWRRRARPATAVLLLLGLLWAGVLDPAAPDVDVVVLLAAAVATADLAERLPERARVLAPLGLALLALPSLAYRPPDPLRPDDEAGELGAWRSALHWMRVEDASPTPWSHPGARPTGCVLTAPGFGATVAAGARWAVLSAAPPGLRADAGRAEEAAELLTGPADEARVDALRALEVERVVVGAAMRADVWLASALATRQGPTLFDALLDGAPPKGLEREWPTEPGPAAVSIWRVMPRPREEVPTTVRPR